MIKVAILTVSDRCAAGQCEDLSGAALSEMLSAAPFELCERTLVSDEAEAITAELVRCADQAKVDLVLTTGGTGLGPRDVTPEATVACCDRRVPGIAELLRAESLKHTPYAILSRGVAALRGRTLVVNLPGSPEAVRECLDAIRDVLPHAVEMMHGGGH